MKLQHLRFFTAVVECGGVIKAAEHLHISQPAVSAGIKALEEELGGALFDRGSGRALSLTPAGRRFYHQALEILERCAAAKSEFREQDRRRVRLGLLDTLPPELVPALMEGVAERVPAWRLEIWEGDVARLTRWLGQRRLDLMLSNVQGDAEGVRLLWREALVAVVSPEHPWAACAAQGVGLEQLAAEPFLHRSRCELDALGRAQLRAAGISLRVIMRGERDELVFELVRRGRGITLAPRSLVPADLIAVSVNGLAVQRCIGMQWHPGTGMEVPDTVAELLSVLHGSVLFKV